MHGTAIRVLNYAIFQIQGVPCQKAADSNDDGRVDLADVVFILFYLFKGGQILLPAGSRADSSRASPVARFAKKAISTNSILCNASRTSDGLESWCSEHRTRAA